MKIDLTRPEYASERKVAEALRYTIALNWLYASLDDVVIEIHQDPTSVKFRHDVRQVFMHGTVTHLCSGATVIDALCASFEHVNNNIRTLRESQVEYDRLAEAR